MVAQKSRHRTYLILGLLALIVPLLLACGSPATTGSSSPSPSTASTAPSSAPAASPTTASASTAPAASPTTSGSTGAGGNAASLGCPSGFPSKPIKFVTWSNPGGGGDVLGRQMIAAIERQKLLSQPVVIENRAGGSGAVAMAYVTQQPADGYTVLIVTKNLTLTPLTQKLDTDYTDFTPIQRSQLEPFFVAVRADAPWKSLKDLVASAKTGKVNFGGAFAGSTDNMMFAQLAEKGGFQLTYVPFESGGEAANALVGGSVDAISASPQEVAALVDAKKLKFLATPSANRVPDFPNLPTFKDEGYDVVLEQWRGFVYPKGVSQELVTCMDNILKAGTKDPEFQKYMKTSGLADGYLPGDEFYKALEKETKENKDFLEKSGLLK